MPRLHGRLHGRLLPVALFCCACTSSATSDYPLKTSASPEYPLEISSNGRYFVDQAGIPVLVHGDTAWSLIGELTREEVTQYLDDCAARNFNSLIVTLVEGHYVSDPPNNAYGDPPFLTPGKFSMPNEAYFQHADWVIQQAAARGIQIFLAPVYLGCCSDGWFEPVMDNNSEQDIRQFGAWVGNRYKNEPNLIFTWGNDVFPDQFPQVEQKVQAMAEGLRSAESAAHLMTYHAYPEASAYDVWSFTQESWLDFNATYTYLPVWQRCQTDYAFLPTTPLILFESKYENEHGTNGRQQRVQAYQALLSGAAGQFYGNSPIWHMGVKGGDWQAALSDPGRVSMKHVRALFESRKWYDLVPDLDRTVLTAGLSSGDDRATAAITNDGKTIIIYAPSGRTLGVSLDALSGSNATAWWFNPRDGSVDTGTPLTSSGSRSFTSPTSDDWVLVIDDAAAGLPPPGTGSAVPDGFPEAADTSLMAWYEFSTDGGGNIPDSSGNENDAACSPRLTCPAFTLADGRGPGAYDFTGDGNYIELPNESAFDFTTEFSVSLWMKSSTPQNAWAQLIGKGDSAWGIERQRSSNQVSFTTFAPSADNMVGSTNVFDGQWHHIAAAYDGTQKILYVDGQVDAQEPYSATVSTNNLNLRLGYNSEYTSGQYDGLLDDVRIFSRPLSQAEVLALLVPSHPPAVTITTPTTGTLFSAGQVVQFSADATDTEDGTLSDSAFSWEVVLTDRGSTSTVLTLDGARAGSLTVPVTGLDLTSALQYEIRVTVTDSDGLTDADSVTLDPNRVALTFDTVPSGLMLYLDGSQTATPFTIDSVVGYEHVIEASDADEGQLLSFDSWSDGGAQAHTINTPASATSFIATYTLNELGRRLVAWYEFNGNGGGSVPDSSGNGNDGSCVPGSTCPAFVAVDGQPAGAYDFAGNGNYIELPNESAFDFTTEFSVSLWMKSSTPQNAWAQLIGKGDSAWGIERQRSSNQVSFTTFAPSPDNMVGSTNVFDGQWHHIAAVYDGTQKILYVDGQVDAQESYTATVSTNNLNVRLGYNSEYTSGQYDGLLDDVRIFSRPLSQAEVQQIGAEATP